MRLRRTLQMRSLGATLSDMDEHAKLLAPAALCATASSGALSMQRQLAPPQCLLAATYWNIHFFTASRLHKLVLQTQNPLQNHQPSLHVLSGSNFANNNFFRQNAVSTSLSPSCHGAHFEMTSFTRDAPLKGAELAWHMDVHPLRK